MVLKHLPCALASPLARSAAYPPVGSPCRRPAMPSAMAAMHEWHKRAGGQAGSLPNPRQPCRRDE